MSYAFNDKSPLYLQLADSFYQKIISGLWPAGSKVPAVRDLALQYGVNPNTVQKTLVQMEQDGLVYSVRTTGRYITENQERLDELRRDIIARQTAAMAASLHDMGYSLDETVAALQTTWRTSYGSNSNSKSLS